MSDKCMTCGGPMTTEPMAVVYGEAGWCDVPVNIEADHYHCRDSQCDYYERSYRAMAVLADLLRGAADPGKGVWRWRSGAWVQAENENADSK